MTHRRLTVAHQDGDVSVLAWGPDAPRRAPIHFAHANGFNAQTYDGLLTVVAADRRVFASDLRGHGRTSLPAKPTAMTSWRVYAHDICKTLQRLPGGPFVLGGHSMGATASLLAAAMRPDLVRGLVLAEPVILPARVRWMAKAAQALGFYDRIMPMAAQAARRRKAWPDIAAAYAGYRGRGAFKSWTDQMLHDYLAGGLATGPSGEGVVLACAPEWEAANYRCGPPNVWAAVAKLQMRVILLTGNRGSTCPQPVAKALVDRVKQLKWIHIPGCTHFLPMERPDAVADSLQAIDE